MSKFFLKHQKALQLALIVFLSSIPIVYLPLLHHQLSQADQPHANVKAKDLHLGCCAFELRNNNYYKMHETKLCALVAF